jgi:hypothetical protein
MPIDANDQYVPGEADEYQERREESFFAARAQHKAAGRRAS